MKAMILAAGLGTRLRPLTLERAKPAIPLLGKPLIIRLIEKLMQQGATDFRLNLHHLPHTIENLFQSPPWDSLPVSFSHEPRILGTAGGLKANEAFFDQGTFLMVNGDIVLEFSLEEAIAFHRDRKALATLVLYPQQEPYRHSPIRVDDEGHFRHFKGIWPGNTPRAGTVRVHRCPHIGARDFPLRPQGRVSMRLTIKFTQMGCRRERRYMAFL